MFIELETPELMECDGGEVVYFVWDAFHLVGKFIKKL